MALSKIDTTNMIEDIPQSKLDNNINFRNIIINGDMSIAQRGTSVTGITSGDSYRTVDRFTTWVNSIGTWSMSQDTDVPTGQGFVKSHKIECTTADASLAAGDGLILATRPEGQNLQYLKKGTANAESVTLSFWIKSNKTGTYICELRDQDNSRQISKSYTISASDTWEKKTITFAGDTTGAFDNDNGNSLDINWWLGAGSTYSSGTLSTTWTSLTNADRAVGQVNLADTVSNYINITGIQLEAGTTASDFEFLPYDVNLDRCQRYYFQMQTSYFVVARWDTGSGNPLGQLEFSKEMRSGPTFSTSGTFSTGSGYAGTPSAGDLRTKNCYLAGADSIGADQVRYVHSPGGSGGVIKLDAEL